MEKHDRLETVERHGRRRFLARHMMMMSGVTAHARATEDSSPHYSSWHYGERSCVTETWFKEQMLWMNTRLIHNWNTQETKNNPFVFAPSTPRISLITFYYSLTTDHKYEYTSIFSVADWDHKTFTISFVFRVILTTLTKHSGDF